jgi:MoaA/NifB/PqqE/SkfB family radical SAM enzyme
MKDNIDFGQGVTYDRSRDRFAYDGSKGPLENLSLDRPFKVVYELLGARVRITHVLSAVNADSAHLMPKVCADLGVQKLRFQRFIPYGEGKNHVKKFHIEDSNVDRVVEATMVEAEKAGIEFLPPPAKQFYYGALYVRPDGELMYRDGDGEYDGERSIGNLHAAPLSQIWTKEMGANHRKIVIDQPRFGNKTS